MIESRPASTVWVVVPTYNEADTIEPIVAAILAELPPARRVLVVDDASPDGTGEIADRLAGEREDVDVLHRPGEARARAGLPRRVPAGAAGGAPS